MIRFRLLVLVVAMTTRTFAQDIVHDAGTYAMNETTTRPWSAPIVIASHAQPTFPHHRPPCTSIRRTRSSIARSARLSRLLRLGQDRAAFPLTRQNQTYDAGKAGRCCSDGARPQPSPCAITLRMTLGSASSCKRRDRHPAHALRRRVAPAPSR